MTVKKFLNTIDNKNTRDRYKRAIVKLLNDLGDVSNLSPEDLLEWLNGQGWGSNTRWVNLCGVKKYLRYQYGANHPALELKIKRLPNPPQRVLSENHAGDLLAHFDTTTVKGCRDLAICSLMLDAGLRVSEVCGLELKRVNIQDRCFDTLVKGGRWERGVYSVLTQMYLSTWLGVRGSVARAGVGALFVSVGGLTRGCQLTSDGLKVEVRKWGRRCGFVLSPHDLRRTFAVLSTRSGAPARVLQAAGRWSSMAMVEHYTQAITSQDFEPYFPVLKLME
jgi:integrase/recombinase XerD